MDSITAVELRDFDEIDGMSRRDDQQEGGSSATEVLENAADDELFAFINNELKK